MLERARQRVLLCRQRRQRVAARQTALEVPLSAFARGAHEALVEQRAELVCGQVVHDLSPARFCPAVRPSSPRSAMRRFSSPRARDNRDITVPTGTLSVAAICS